MPWRAPQPVTLLPQKHLAGIASDRTGRRIAMTAADRIKIYDKVDEAWKHVVDIPESDHAIGVLISPDGIRVSHISRYEITTTDVSNERMILRLPSHGCREIACHPKEDWLAVCGDSFGLISLENEPFWRDLHVGGKSDVFSLLGFNLPKSKIENIELEEVKAKQQKAAEKAVEQFRAILKSSNVDATEEAVEELKCNIANAYERWNARFVELKSGVKPPPITSNETVGKVGFSRDGKLFWCATNRGIRVYNWGDINRELGAEMPSPQWHFNFPEEQPPANPGQKNVTATDRVFAIAEEINEPAIVFGGMLGRLYRMDLTTGETREIMTFPGVYWILDLVFSLDGTVLGMTATISPKLADPHDRKTKKTTWDLWSFEKLVGARGNLYSE
jgi:hypothetical protein